MNTTIESLLQGPRYPDKEFIRSGATFGEVYAMAASLRTALADPKKYTGTAICLASDNKAIMAAALLASLAGGPSLLVPYAFSGKALARIQQTSGFTTAISDVPRKFPQGVDVICPQPERSAAIPISSQASPQNELLKIFTGGSSGSPQVWSKTGANIFEEGFFLARHYEVNAQDCIVTTIPPYHIYGLLFSVVLPLVTSATIIAGTPSFPGEIVQVVQKEQATILASVPPHYRVLRDKKCNDSCLRLAFSSAGMLEATDNKAFCGQNNAGIVEVYGSTETGGIAGRNRSLGEEHFTPFPTIDWKIIRDRLAVRSPYISPDLPTNKDGFFITGDRVEARGSNSFSLQGRADGVTKVGGKRVDLEEIRTLIKNMPEVIDCVVIALPDPGGREHRICALISGAEVKTKIIKKTLAETLEAYALPRRIKTVDSIPMQENGKYNRIAIVQLLEA